MLSLLLLLFKKHSASTDLHQGKSGLNPQHFQQYSGDLLVHRYICGKIFIKIQSVVFM